MNKAQKLLVALFAASALSNTSFAAENAVKIELSGGVAMLPAISSFTFPLAADKTGKDDLSTFKGKDLNFSWGAGLGVEYIFSENISFGGEVFAMSIENKLYLEAAKNDKDDEDKKDKADKKKEDENKDYLSLSTLVFMPALKATATTELSEGLNASISLHGGVAIGTPSAVYYSADAKAADTPKEEKPEDKAKEKKEDKLNENKLEHLVGQMGILPFVAVSAGVDYKVTEIVSLGLFARVNYIIGEFAFNLKEADKKEQKEEEKKKEDKEKAAYKFAPGYNFVVGLRLGFAL